ncbi:DUF4312 family protein [Caproiciproducens sp. CPB-2]|uniref:DUF4312 family protein n=1 Tax=Caproiciproducens sp. CPB-2 TaxID=3030017 RepID=UPI0023DB6D81|nr:DUF4312 family protein [Caproiciproducens sp. CPB-2]MDF1493440.1 DUF4312 family protein [Caproiciproducens sp. CPB-2]
MLNNLQNKQLLKEISHELVVTASGDSLESVTGKLFQNMRKQIFAEFRKPIIQMEAEEVFFQKVDTKSRTEHFMLFFWPREKVAYTITAKIVVKVKYLDIAKEEL